MATTWYVDGANGNNAWDGSSKTFVTGTTGPKQTIVGARAITLANDLVVVAPGIYPEADQFWSSANDVGVVYMADATKPGIIIVDFENRAGSQLANNGAANWRFGAATIFLNIMFRNPYPGNTYAMMSSNAGLTLIHCTLYQKDGTANTGRAFSAVSSIGDPLHAINCTAYNLGIGWYSTTVGSPTANNYLVSVSSMKEFTSGTSDYNAYAGNVETNGINISSGANPGFRDTVAEDFRLDPTTNGGADYATFMTAGLGADRIGAYGRGGVYYNPTYPQLRFLSPVPSTGNPQPSWENEGPAGTNTYIKGTAGNIEEDATTKQLKINLAGAPTGGRVRSEVIDLGPDTTRITSISFGSFEDIDNGAAFDTDNALPQKIEYRSSNSSFLKGDASPSWTEITKGEYINVAHRYLQLRLEFRTDHNNA